MRDIMNTKSALLTFGIVAIMFSGIGLVVAQGGSGGVGVTAALLPSGTSVVCAPATIDAVGSVYTTVSTCTATGSPDATSVTFATSDGTGSFSAPSCSLSGGVCSVTYSDTATAGATPTITASFAGDSVTYGANQETTDVTVNPLTCGISLSSDSIDLSSGNQPIVTMTNIGNINGELYLLGTVGSEQCRENMGTSSVAWTTYGVSEAAVVTPMASTPADIGAVTPTTPIPIQFGLTFPAQTQADAYSSSIAITTSC